MDPAAAQDRRFWAHNAHLTAVAARMLGSVADAEDVLQEAWLRYQRSDTDDVRNMRAWLTTVVSRLCLNRLEQRRRRGERPLEVEAADALTAGGTATTARVDTPEDVAVRGDQVAGAMMVVLDVLSPEQRVAFVLHDLFGVEFNTVATILDKEPAATRQLASRARTRLAAADEQPEPQVQRQRSVVQAFLDAAHDGQFETLLSLLHPDMAMRADEAAIAMGAQPEMAGARTVAEFMSGGAQAATISVVGDSFGAMWMHRGEAKVVFCFTVTDGRVAAIDLVADPDDIAALAPAQVKAS